MRQGRGILVRFFENATGATALAVIQQQDLRFLAVEVAVVSL
jgi:hypothetical protein